MRNDAAAVGTGVAGPLAPLAAIAEADATLLGIASHARVGLGMPVRNAAPPAVPLASAEVIDETARQRFVRATDLSKG